MKIYQMKARGVDDTPYLFATVQSGAGEKLMMSYFKSTHNKDKSISDTFDAPDLLFTPHYSPNSSDQLPDIDELLGNDGLVLSSEAQSVLEDLLVPSGELLHFSNRDDYKLFYCSAFLDPFINDETYVTKGFSTLVKIHSFDAQAIEGIDVFNTIYDPRQCYVSEKFKQTIEASGLRCNLMFPLIWDSEDPDFRDETWDASQWLRIKADPESTFLRLDRA